MIKKILLVSLGILLVFGFINSVFGGTGTSGNADLDYLDCNDIQANNIYINNGTANFSLLMSSNEADGTWGCAAGDLDGDGDLDYIAGNTGAGSDSVYVNNGSGNMTLLMSATAYSTQAVAIGDLDSDGDLDYVTGDVNQNHVYLNNGSGNMTELMILDENENTVSVALGDLDGDGDLDYITGGAVGIVNRVYLNNGSGNMTLLMTSAETDNTDGIGIADLDSDGDLDYIAGNDGTANRVYINNGSGNMTLLMSSAETDNTYDVFLGDLDNDGDIDYIAGNFGGANRVYLNNGSGNMTLLMTSAETSGTWTIAGGDLDNDGDIDYISGNNNPGFGEANEVYLNNGSGNMTLFLTSSEVNDAYSIVIGDFDADGSLTETNCTDGLDNDLDGWIDAQDSDCATDTTDPNITINSPLNQTYGLSSIDFNLTVLDETATSSCWYTLNSGITNYTMSNTTASAFNATNTSMAQGSHVVQYYCNDSSNNINNSESVTIFIDSINPDISIVYPNNNTNTTDNKIDVNYTVSDTNLDSCWYSNDTFLVNTTLANCANITTITWTEGIHNVTVWTNDSANNINWSSVSFTVDSTPPYFIQPLQNRSLYVNESLNYNINATDSGIGFDSYAINWTTTFQINSTGWLKNVSGLSVGLYYINVSINDSLNNINSSIILINVSGLTDSIPPNVTINNLTSRVNLSASSLNFNITSFDDNLVDSCWYTLNGGIDNVTMLNTSVNAFNFTNTSIGDKNYLVEFYCNDSSNNINNSESINFTIDTTAPGVSFLCAPTTISTGATITCSCSGSDSGTGVLSTSYTVNPDTSIAGSYSTSCTVNDYAGNSNLDNIAYTVSGGGGSGGGGAGAGPGDDNGEEPVEPEPVEGECISYCNGQQCGEDGCGGSCGSCGTGENCISGFCVKEECEPSFECSEWGSCSIKYSFENVLNSEIIFQGTQTRSCVDSNNCADDRIESKSCETSKSILVEDFEEENCEEGCINIIDPETKKIAAKLRKSTIFGFNLTRIDIAFAVTEFTGNPFYCFDKEKNYDEIRIDCGGSCEDCIELFDFYDWLSLVRISLWGLLGLFVIIFIRKSIYSFYLSIWWK